MLTEGSLLQSQAPDQGLGTWRGRQQTKSLPCGADGTVGGYIVSKYTPWEVAKLALSSLAPENVSRLTKTEGPCGAPELELAGGSGPCFPVDPALVALGSSWNVDSEF